VDRLKIALIAVMIASPAAAQQCGTLTTCPPVSTPLAGTELLYVVQGGVSKKITTAQLGSALYPYYTLTPGVSPIGPSANGGVLWDNNGVLGDSQLTGDVTNAAGSLATTVGKIGGVSISLGGAFTTTGAATPTLAFGASGAYTYTYPSASVTLASTANIATALPSAMTSQLYGGTGGAGVAQDVSLGTHLSIGSNTLSTDCTAADTASTLVCRDASAQAALTTLTLGVQQTTQGSLVLANTVAHAYPTTIESSNSATAASTLILPPALAGSGPVVLADAAGNGTLSWLAAATANTASTLVERDGSGNFSAGTITAALSGNASTATSATTATNANNGATVATTTNQSYYPLFAASSANGNQPFNLGAGLSFNPSTNLLTTTELALGGCTIGSNNFCVTGPTNLAGATTIASASFGLSGNISAAAWTTNGVRYKNVAGTLTDTSSSGTVAAAYTDLWSGNTIAASNAVTFTNYYGSYFKNPVAGTNVTLTNTYALGADSVYVNNLVQAGSVLVSSTSGLGFAAGGGAGGTVTQSSSKSTGVTLNKASGAITMNGAALAAGTIVSFVLTDSAIAATDTLILNHISGGTPGSYTLNAQAAAGSATINVRNASSAALSEAIVIEFTVIKGVTSWLAPANDNFAELRKTA
jgi:hypothetical protein